MRHNKNMKNIPIISNFANYDMVKCLKNQSKNWKFVFPTNSHTTATAQQQIN